MFINSFKTFKIKFLCKKYFIKNYTINKDGSIDVSGDVILISRELSTLPLRFRNVKGDFHCSHNRLTSLYGCPKKVDGHFYCGHNLLTSFTGSPENIGGDFHCSHNRLSNFIGMPQKIEIGGKFYINHNRIDSFKGFPENYNKDLPCDSNPIANIYFLNPTKDFIDMIIEYDVISRDGQKVSEMRLREALKDSGKGNSFPDDRPIDHLITKYELIP